VGIKRIPLCLNINDPDQNELYEFVTLLANGKKRNSSAFLKLLVDREYQKRKDQYLSEKEEFTQKKETPAAPRVEVKKREIKYLAKDIDQNTNQSPNSSSN
jgi:hypothetical protein